MRRLAVAAPLLGALLLGGWVRSAAQSAGEAYIFGFPLVLMDETRSSMARRAGSAQSNVLVHLKERPTPADRVVVRPNLDTLYSLAWLDLSEGPVTLRWPAMGERYWLLQVLDAWSDVVGRPGTQESGGAAGAVLITGPDWSGTVPPGVGHIAVETEMAWLLGRIAAGPGELEQVRSLQEAFSLTGPPVAIPLRPDAGLRPPDAVRALTPADFFGRLSALVADNPGRPEDAEMLARLEVLSAEQAGPLRAWAVQKGVSVARQRLAEAITARQPGPSGWLTPPAQLGDYGTDYHLRAGVALVGLGANKPVDAIYPTATVDGEGRILHGSHTYTLQLAADAQPPAEAFWSLTVYDAEGWLLPDGPHSLGSQHALTAAADGTLTVTFSPDCAETPNCLSVVPGAPFQVTARLYAPGPEALEGRWQMPPLVRAD